MAAGVLDISMTHLSAAFLGPFHLFSFIVARGIRYSLAVMPVMANFPTTTTHFKLVDPARYPSFSHKNAIGCKSNFLISIDSPTKKILFLYRFPLSPLPLPLSLLPPPMYPIFRNLANKNTRPTARPWAQLHPPDFCWKFPPKFQEIKKKSTPPSPRPKLLEIKKLD